MWTPAVGPLATCFVAGENNLTCKLIGAFTVILVVKDMGPSERRQKKVLTHKHRGESSRTQQIQ